MQVKIKEGLVRMSVNMDRKAEKVTIKLNRRFYNIGSIRRGIKDFSGLCSADVNNAEQFEIVLKSKGGLDVQILGYEFCNYVLALMKNNNTV